MWQFLKRLLGLGGQINSSVDPAFIDQLVDTASPRIKMADSYRQRLAPLVEHACSLVHVLGEKLPAPVALTAESWRNNRLLGVAFANPDRMAELVASDERIRHWFREHPLAERAYAILGMSHTVELRYGLEEHNGLVRHDVPQEVLVLRDHLFGEPVGDVHELNRQARLRAMEELANHAARRIQGLETDRKQIEEEINTLRIAIRYGGSTDPISASPQQRQRQQRLANLQQDLADLRRALEPDMQLETLCAALATPENQLRYTETELLVDAMGIVRNTDPQAKPVRLVEIEMIADNPVRRVLLPVEIPKSLIQREDGGSAEAALFSITSY